MSLDGWHFQKWQMGLVFEKGEPADITYCVEVFPKGSEMDLKPEEQAEEYADYCSVAGWELIDGQRKSASSGAEIRMPCLLLQKRNGLKMSGKLNGESFYGICWCRCC